jgi:hypothetical protein
MQRLVTESEFAEYLDKVYTTAESEMSTELYRTLVLDCCRFYGAAIELCREIEDNKLVHRIARLTSKSWADDFLVRKHKVDRYWAHSAANTVTHRNLPPVKVASYDDFELETFYQAWKESNEA